MSTQMTPELEKALSFLLPNGKKLGDASPEDFAELAEQDRERAERINDMTMEEWLNLSDEEMQRLRARAERDREFNKAADIVSAHFDAEFGPAWRDKR